MKFFKPSDFAPLDTQEDHARMANAKLVSDMQPICSVNHKEFICGGCFKEFDMIEKKPTCKHPVDKIEIKYKVYNSAYNSGTVSWYQCDCGKEVTPATFQEK